MTTQALIAPDEEGFVPNGWVNPYPHSDLNGPCTSQCCEPESYPQPLSWNCQADPACSAQLKSPGECINCTPPSSSTSPA